MQPFNPWFFANSQPKNTWPFSSMDTSTGNPFSTSTTFGQFNQSNLAQQQMMQYWQQQIQQLQASPMMQSFTSPTSIPGFDPSQFSKLQSSILQSQQTVQNATSELMQSLMKGVTDNNQLRKIFTAFARSIVRANFLQVAGLHNPEMQSSIYKQMKTSLQWAIEQCAAINVSYYADIEKNKKTLGTWLDFIDASSAMLESYNTFTEQVCSDFAEHAIESIGKQEVDPRDSKKLLELLTAYYEKDFTKWLQSDDYRTSYGNFINCSTALRKDQQNYIDSFVESFGLPSKQEMDTTHKRAHDQGKKIRSLQQLQTEALAQQESNIKAIEVSLNKLQKESSEQLRKTKQEVKEAKEANKLSKEQAAKAINKVKEANSEQFKTIKQEIKEANKLSKVQAIQISRLQSVVKDLSDNLKKSQDQIKIAEENVVKALQIAKQATEANTKKEQEERLPATAKKATSTQTKKEPQATKK